MALFPDFPTAKGRREKEGAEQKQGAKPRFETRPRFSWPTHMHQHARLPRLAVQ